MKKEYLIDFLVVLPGNAVLSPGVRFFILPNNILTGGLPGIAVAVEPVFHLNPTLMGDIPTIFFFILGAICFVKKFTVQTALSNICYPVF